MSLEEIFAQAILTGGVTILNCSVVIGSNAQVSDFLQNTAASNQNLKVDQEITRWTPDSRLRRLP